MHVRLMLLKQVLPCVSSSVNANFYPVEYGIGLVSF